MKKTSFLVLSILLVASLPCFALDYTITFTGTGASTSVGSVIVQNLTRGTTVTVPAGNTLNLSDIATSVYSLNIDQGISIYPNPMQGKATVSFFAKQAGNTQLNAFSIDGRKIAGITENLQTGVNSFQLSFPKGAFFIQVVGNGYTYNAKMINQTGTVRKPEIAYIGTVKQATSAPQKSKSSALGITTMTYYNGDRLLYKGISGNYSTIVTDIPTGSKNMNFGFVPCQDTDLNNYSVVTIGTQTWMAENLKTTKYNDGTAIPLVTDNTAWTNLSTAAWCDCFNLAANGTKYGHLYNWYAAIDSRNIAPVGWHVPTDAEWTTLTTYLGGESVAGCKLKEAGTGNWESPNECATNETGFSALPGAQHSSYGNFTLTGINGYWWSTSESSCENGTTHAWNRDMGYGFGNAYRDCSRKPNGFSVRCLRDFPPSISTSSASMVSTNSATSGGNITSDGGGNITSRGVCWSTSPNPTTSNSKTTDGTGTGSFTSSLTGLTAGTTYYVRAYATNDVDTGYGTQITFTTNSLQLPTLTTTAATSITTTSATSGGNITSDGGGNITSRGVCWSTSANPTTSNSKTTDGTGTGSFTSSLTGLTAGTTYYVRAYATNDAGTGYGTQITFTTNSLQLPTLTTTAATSITTTSATSGGNITSDGGGNITSRGVCWSTSANPTIAASKTTDTGTTGIYTSSITGLTAGTTYYVRAYATNSVGTAYGNEVSFTALANLPTVTTKDATSIAATTAASGGNVTADGGAAVTARGVCWSTTTNPTIADSKTSDGAGIGSFTSTITGLTANTTYFVRAYATSSAGTGYGGAYSFATPLLITFNPNLTYGSVTDIDGNIYKTITIGTQTWMAENLKTTKYKDGTDIPLITNNTEWAALSTPGYYCWYSNDASTYKGTYGALYNWYTVNTGKLCPTGWHVPTDAEWTTLTTYLGGESVAGGKLKEAGTGNWASPNTGATNETGFSALPGGYRFDDGTFYSVGNNGYWWSSTMYDTYNARYRILYYDGSNVNRSIYYKKDGFSVRCVKDTIPTVTDIDGNVYQTVTIGTQTWMASNLRVTHYRDGSLIANVTDNTAWVGLSTGAWCDYSNLADNGTKYGHLYNWYAASDTRNIAPVGWHVATDAEWTTLTTYLGGESVAGGKLKEAGTGNWASPNTGATNETGFSALPGGYRGYNGTFASVGIGGDWWSSSEYSATNAWYSYMNFDNSGVYRSNAGKSYGTSVLCVKDY